VNKEFKAIIDGLKESKETPLHKNSRILLIDSLNTFLRSFVMIHHINPQGNHIGGLTGYLKSIGFAIRHIKPTRVILVFDGHGGSTNKRYLYPEYKANRKINKISNWDGFDSQAEESASITDQLVRLIDYLKCLPVDMLSIDKIEADDVIAHISNTTGDSVHIMSSDRDYLQLVSDRVTVYSPVKKKFYTPKAVLDEYGIPANNFLTQKILLGDSSDNVPGVQGLGVKTMLKLYPALKEPETLHIEQILEHAEKEQGKYKKIYDFRQQLAINKQLMNLHEVNIPEEDLIRIQHVIDNPNMTVDKATFMKYYAEDCLGNSIPNVATWFYDTFQYLTGFKLAV
jgi:DNA polymerase-1